MKNLLALAALLALAGCDYSKSELMRLAKSSVPCRPGDTCVVMPATDCTCAMAVNARHIEALQTRIDKIDCEGETIVCAPVVGEPKCVDDRCAFARSSEEDAREGAPPPTESP